VDDPHPSVLSQAGAWHDEAGTAEKPSYPL